MMTIKQAAEALGISVATVYQLCAARRIRHERPGLGRGRIRIPEAALEEYRQTVTVGTTETPSVQPSLVRFKHLQL
jgi:excisionase family DNA binding protein